MEPIIGLTAGEYLIRLDGWSANCGIRPSSFLQSLLASLTKIMLNAHLSKLSESNSPLQLLFYRFFPVSVVPFFYFSDKYILKIPKIFSVLEKIFQLDRSHGSLQCSVTQYVAVEFKSSMNTQQNHFDLN